MPDVFAGRFELRTLLARGGMGEVWTALDHQSRDMVAVKLMRQSDASGLLRFIREQTMRIHHPNVLTPLAWAGMDDRVLFSMPLVTGGSVATLVGDYGGLPTRYAAELLRQLSSAVRAVHAAGIVHRDIKPSNLLLDATGTGRPRLRLTDFGVAVRPDGPRLTTVASVIGTPGYLSPEQMRGDEPTPAQDLYAIGRVGQEVLTGLAPSPEAPATPHAVDRELWQVLSAMSDETPDRRPGLDALDAVLARPELAWVDQDEIEVFEQVTSEGAVEDAMTTRRHSLPRAAHPQQAPTAHPRMSPGTPTPAAQAVGMSSVAPMPPNPPTPGIPPAPGLAAGPPASSQRPPAAAVGLVVLGALLMVFVVWYYLQG